jgi:hypothetical protein
LPMIDVFVRQITPLARQIHLCERGTSHQAQSHE